MCVSAKHRIAALQQQQQLASTAAANSSCSSSGKQLDSVESREAILDFELRSRFGARAVRAPSLQPCSSGRAASWLGAADAYSARGPASSELAKVPAPRRLPVLPESVAGSEPAARLRDTRILASYKKEKEKTQALKERLRFLLLPLRRRRLRRLLLQID